MRHTILASLIAVTCGLAMAGCGSAQQDDSAAAPNREAFGMLEVAYASHQKKTAADQSVIDLMQSLIFELRSAPEASGRISAARGLGMAAESGLIGVSSRVAAEALYEVSRSDADAHAKEAAADALGKVEQYRRGTVTPKRAELFEMCIADLANPDPKSRQSAVEAIGKGATWGWLGKYVLQVEPVLRGMAHTDPDPGVRKAIDEALPKIEAHRATLDLPAAATPPAR